MPFLLGILFEFEFGAHYRNEKGHRTEIQTGQSGAHDTGT